ncbi:hypothetical protein CDL12_24190 [Handroanthus impetiginosus]|uniref:Methyl-CpG binding transcription regulator n=1 Tax=Handroanthus impetiginosus TaxID=429701 RepID=A0A2G9GDK9_9LAMI|nr:hypothetical protein CDL12_24190 [Handroanthus impetiginosus]
MAQGSSTSTPKRVWDSIDLYAVRCFVCLKWRIIPSKEKYEEIRENIVEKPFVCDTALEWRSDVSCEDDSDIKEGDNIIWAMDKPNIPQTPPGWQRIIRLRAEGGTKFSDVYYVSPSNKRFRSMTELQRYLDDHPEYQQENVDASQFSFQAPIALDENYVAKNRPEKVEVECVGPETANAEAEAPEAAADVLSSNEVDRK